MLSEEYKGKIQSCAYFGKQGYTVLKSLLLKEDLLSLKRELTMTPLTPGAPKTVVAASFPCYRENENKIYLPRFYAEERYGIAVGKPPQYFQGNKIDISFESELRPEQKDIVDYYLNHVSQEGSGGAILEVPCGRGKTVMALYILAKLKKKTIILVHKEFLMNQWIERIQQFLGSSVRIGKIQGPCFDVENKDIVIAMIQSIYDSESRYQVDHFGSFGLTIIDETHRIGSQQFCQALWKLPMQYMLGISATVERKDGLTKILYHFIGPKIYSETTREKDTNVTVRAIQFQSEDEMYLHVERDFHGNTKIANMISKLCSFEPRLHFAVQVIKSLLTDYPQNQIMVLCQQRNLLLFLNEKIESFCTSGFYVGGMKETLLKSTEGKKVVLATYAMAAEALDIKTLSTLVLLSPKVDVIQAVGRILRERHDNPMIIDIVDPQICFQNQWQKRKRYYQSCGYPIFQTSNALSMFTDHPCWKPVEEKRKSAEGCFEMPKKKMK